MENSSKCILVASFVNLCDEAGVVSLSMYIREYILCVVIVHLLNYVD